MVLEQDEAIGTQFVHLIRQETPFRAILATSLEQVRSILVHLKCDLFLLIDPTFPEEELERLYLLPEGIEPPAWLSATFLSCTSNHRDKRDIKSIVKAVKLLLSVRDNPPGERGNITQMPIVQTICPDEVAACAPYDLRF